LFPFIVEPEYLAGRLQDNNVLIVDLCQTGTWDQGHIPGAVHVHPSELVSGIEPATGKLPGQERLTALFARVGYSPELQIVAYDDEGGGWAGRFIWTLDAIGHHGHSLLNGGLIAWLEEGFPVESKSRPRPPTNVDITIRREPVASKEDVLASIADPGVVLWDARSPEEYAGIKKAAARAGHIPGAINLDWLETMDRDNHRKVRADIAEVLETRGITPDKKVITYCQTHHRSGLTYAIGKALGYHIQGYDGSWSEWGNEPDTPVEHSPVTTG